jgi:hypothetical protein
MVFYILTRSLPDRRVDSLYDNLSQFGETVVIRDTEEEKIEGYYNSCSSNHKPTTAWDIFFRDCIKTDDAWVFEDDVAASMFAIDNLLSKTSGLHHEVLTNRIEYYSQNPDWYWGFICDDIPVRSRWISLNCCCFMRSRLLNRIEDFRKFYSKYTFHEAMIPSVAKSRLDLAPLFDYKIFGFPTYTHRNDIKINKNRIDRQKIYHPIKDFDLHAYICGLS